MLPLFSIITVTYNAESTVRRTLASVAEQPCTLYEHIVVDGLSTDSTPDIVRSAGNPRLRLVSRKDSGIYDAMNNGLAEAQGDYIIFLNAGDTFHSPDTLQVMADAIMDNHYPGIVYGQTDLVDNDGHKVGERHLRAPETLTLDSLKDGMVVCHQAMAVNRRVASAYDLRYRYSADYEWLLRCLQHSRCNVYIPRVICDYLSEGTTTAHHRASLRERFSIMVRYFGVWTAVSRHAKFLIRYLRRRSSAANVQ